MSSLEYLSPHSSSANRHSDGLTDRVDLYRVASVRDLDPARRAEMGQYPTPPAVARFMARMFGPPPAVIELLDAGVGVGTLTAAFVEEMCGCPLKPTQIEAVAYELDAGLADYLRSTLSGCED